MNEGHEAGSDAIKAKKNIVWANFALGSNSVKGKARPNILYEGIRTSEDDQPRNG